MNEQRNDIIERNSNVEHSYEFNPNPIAHRQNTTNPLEAKMDSVIPLCICRVHDRIDRPIDNQTVGSQHKEEQNRSFEVF